jgi:carbon starvation protein
MWGWLPIMLYILIGNVFLGTVQDYLSLVLSERHDAATMMKVASEEISPKVARPFYFVYLFGIISVGFYPMLGMLMQAYPMTGTVTILFLFISILFGLMVSKMRIDRRISTIVCLALSGLAFYVAWLFPISLPSWGWIIVMQLYAFIGALLPWDMLIEPRQHLTVYYLWGLMILGFIALIIKPLSLGAGFPMFQFTPTIPAYGPLWPMLFSTCLCGALSVHPLIHSTQTVRMLSNEKHMLLAGYGAMSSEGTQALLVLAAVLHLPYTVYSELVKTAGPLGTFTYGFGDILTAVGIPLELGIILGGFWCVTFVADMDAGRKSYAITLAEAFKWDISKWKYNILANGIHLVVQTILCFVFSLAFLVGSFGGINRGYAALFAYSFLMWLLKDKKPTWFIWPHIIFLLPTSLGVCFYLIYRDVIGLLPKIGTPDLTMTVLGDAIGAIAVSVIMTAVFLYITWEWWKAYQREKSAQRNSVGAIVAE